MGSKFFFGQSEMGRGAILFEFKFGRGVGQTPFWTRVWGGGKDLFRPVKKVDFPMNIAHSLIIFD